MHAINHTHSPTPEEIMEYLDGEGTASSRNKIAAHLATCSACQHVAAGQRDLSDRARAWQVPPAPASMRAPFLADTVAAPVFRPRASWMFAGLAAAAVLALVVTVGEWRPAPRSSALGIDAAARPVPPVARPEADGSVRGATSARAITGSGGGRERVNVTGRVEDRAQAVAQAAGSQAPRTPAIIRTALLRIVVKDFGAARTSVETLVTQVSGFIDHLSVTGDTNAARTLSGSLRIPSDRMADTLVRLRGLGQVIEDTQGSQDATDQIVDLDARVASARATEHRLIEVLRDRTGRLSDVLEVERELTRVRLDIERLVAEKTNVGRRVSYATIDITISEERKASLDGPLSLATRLRIAAADGVEAAFDSVAATVLFALRAGPSLVFWGGLFTLAWLLFGRRIHSAIRDPRSGIHRYPRFRNEQLFVEVHRIPVGHAGDEILRCNVEPLGLDHPQI